MLGDRHGTVQLMHYNGRLSNAYFERIITWLDILDSLTHLQELGDPKNLEQMEPLLIMELNGVLLGILQRLRYLMEVCQIEDTQTALDYTQ